MQEHPKTKVKMEEVKVKRTGEGEEGGEKITDYKSEAMFCLSCFKNNNLRNAHCVSVTQGCKVHKMNRKMPPLLVSKKKCCPF